MRARAVILGGMLAIAAFAASFTAGASGYTRTQLDTIHPDGAASHRGIGPVRLNEPQHRVTHGLGAGHKVSSSGHGRRRSSEYHYLSGSLVLDVIYVGGRVAGIDTSSRAAILFGHRLSEGLAVFKSILVGRPGWQVDGCNNRVFTALAPGGPGTGIEWNAGRLEVVQIDVGGVLDDCAFL